MKSKLLLSILCMLTGLTVRAQNWGGGIDDSDFNFGFTFQYVSSEYKILKNPTWRTIDPKYNTDLPSTLPRSLSSISAKPSPGFGIGFVVNKKLLENVDFRVTPILVFNDRIVNYRFQDDPDAGIRMEDVEKKVQSTLVEFPLSLKIKSNRRNNFRGYMMGGIKFSSDISSKKKSNNDLVTDEMEKFLNNKRNFLSYEAGLGMDLYFEYFKMSPEIKLSYSFNDVMKREAHVFSDPISKLMLRHVTFSLFFE